MPRNLWMRPALQKSEAVLMPALQRRPAAEATFSDRYARMIAKESTFLPAVIPSPPETTALSTYVRPRGSVAGRSVLRAVGMLADPLSVRGRPLYYQKRQPVAPRKRRER